MHALGTEVYYDFGSVSLVAHFYFAEVDGHSNSKVVGVATIAGSAAVAALVGFGLLAGFVEVLIWIANVGAGCLGF